ncbi:MAG: tetratricopeptide repeat protein [Calditrichia bacterium]
MPKKKPKEQEQADNAFIQSPNMQGDGGTQRVHYGNIINQYISGDKLLPKFLTGTPPQNAGFVGRKEDLRQLETSLNDAGAVVVVNGLGGIGKTELCRHFFHEQKTNFDHLLWVDYFGSFRESLVRAISAEVFTPQQGQTLDEQFALIMHLIANLPVKSLLVVDDILDAEDADLANLRGLPLKVVTSSRLQLAGFESYPLGFLDVESCREIFYRFYKGKRDVETLEEIIDLAGQHTLTVELLAKTANHAKISITVLLERLKEIGFNLNEALPKKVKTLWHDQIDEKKLFEHLNNVFNMEGLSAEEAHVLANLCVLPSEPMEAQMLSDWLQDDISDTLTSLVAKGWLSEQEGFEVFLHPIIAAVARERLKPTAGGCSKLIESLTNLLTVQPGDNPLAKASLVPYAEDMVSYLTDANTSLARFMERLAWIYYHFGRITDSLEVQLRGIDIEEKLLEADDLSLANSYNNLSLIYNSLGRFEDALESQQKALNCRESVLGVDHPDIAQSYNNLSLIYNSLGRFEDALESQQKALKIKMSVLDATHPSLATSYNNLSTVYLSLGRLEDGLEAQQKAVNIRESVLDATHPSLAQSYNNLSSIYQSLDRLEDGLEVQLKAHEIFGAILDERHPDLATSYSNLSTVYRSLGRLEDALDAQQKALKIREPVLHANHPDLALSCWVMGSILEDMRHFEAALNYCSRAAEIYHAALPEEHPYHQKIQDFIDRISKKM